jgi:hypothetical protein
LSEDYAAKIEVLIKFKIEILIQKQFFVLMLVRNGQFELKSCQFVVEYPCCLGQIKFPVFEAFLN